MTATYVEAVDDIFGLFNSAWDSNAGSIVGSVPTVYWQGNEPAQTPGKDSFHVHVGTQTVIEQQTTFKTGVAPSENKRYTANGLVVIQLYCPMSVSDSMDKGRQLAVLARNAFRGKESANNVWFRNVRINELPAEDDYYRLNIIADFEYDDLG